MSATCPYNGPAHDFRPLYFARGRCIVNAGLRTMKWVPVEDVSTPRGGTCDVLIDYWWLVNDQGRVALHDGKHPQANSDPAITSMMVARTPEAVGTIRVPVAFTPHDCGDYR